MFAWSRNDTRNDIKSKILSSLVWISKEFLWSTVPVSFYRSSRYITKLSVDRNPILGLESAKKQTRIPVVLDLGSRLRLRQSENLLYCPFKIFVHIPLSNLDQELDLGSGLCLRHSKNLLY
jgi:hypothetical protein